MDQWLPWGGRGGMGEIGEGGKENQRECLISRSGRWLHEVYTCQNASSSTLRFVHYSMYLNIKKFIKDKKEK